MEYCDKCKSIISSEVETTDLVSCPMRDLLKEYGLLSRKDLKNK